MNVIKMQDLDLSGQRVLIRQDLNVPITNGQVSSDARLKAALPTLKLAIEQGAKVKVMSHLGRPKEGAFDEEFSLAPVAKWLADHLDTPVRLEKNWLDPGEHQGSELILCENVRFNHGEKADDEDLSNKLASLCDVFVMDAFGTAHRAQASTHGVIKKVVLQNKIACAGPLLASELEALDKALAQPAQPLIAIVGGSKVSTKLEVLNSLAEKCSKIIVGGGIANTFLAAQGFNVGKSLYEEDLLPTAKKLLSKIDIPLPSDVVVGKEFSSDTHATIKKVSEVSDDDMIFDIGPDTAASLSSLLASAGTILWNGPVGVFEFDQFSAGTKALSHAIAESSAFSIAGGGDTLAAIDKYDIANDVSYISTGGGAFLEFVEGKTLPAVEALLSAANSIKT